MKLGEVIDLIYSTLPHQIDRTPKGEFVIRESIPGLTEEEFNSCFSKNEFYEKYLKKVEEGRGYFENSENNLKVEILSIDCIHIYYEDEDGEDSFFLGDCEDDEDDEENDGEAIYLNPNDLDKNKIIALFSKRFGWIENFED